MSSSSGHKNTHWLLFSGHRIDAPDRATPRFPAGSEPIAREMISAAIREELSRCPDDSFRGVSSGANGGDILFLESCAAQDVPTEIYLALAEKDFARLSVADAGGDWLERYEALLNARPVHVLPDEPSSRLDIWQRTNLWMVDSVLSHAGANVTVIVLWDGNAADGPGGTKDMVKRAQAIGARVVHLDAMQLT